MTDEEIIGIIPSFRIPSTWGINIFAMILSKRRLMFIRIGYDGYSGIVGLAIEASQKSQIRKLGSRIVTETENLQDIDFDLLLKSDKSNFSVYLKNIVEIQLIKGFTGGYRMDVYEMQNNKRTLVTQGFFVPPEDYYKDRKKAGHKTKIIMKEYALESQKLINNLFLDRVTREFPQK